jgi:hypothetical protein
MRLGLEGAAGQTNGPGLRCRHRKCFEKGQAKVAVPSSSEQPPDSVGTSGVAVGGASDQLPLQGSFTLCGPERVVGPGRVLDTPAEVRAQ